MKKYFEAGKTGIIIGLVSSIIFSILSKTGNFFSYNSHSTLGKFYQSHFNEITIFIWMICLWFIIGIMFQCANQLFDRIDNLLMATFYHFVITLFSLGGLGYLCAWFSLSWIVSFAVLYAIIYFLMYLIYYFNIKKNIMKVNDKLTK